MSGNTGGILSRDAQIGLNSFWGVALYYYNATGGIEYICAHENQDAGTSDENWAIWKHTYTGGELSQREVLTGICNNRATLDWR